MILYNEEWHLPMYEYGRKIGNKSIGFYILTALSAQILITNLFEAIFLNNFIEFVGKIVSDEENELETQYKSIKKLINKNISKAKVKFENIRTSVLQMKNSFPEVI